MNIQNKKSMEIEIPLYSAWTSGSLQLRTLGQWMTTGSDSDANLHSQHFFWHTLPHSASLHEIKSFFCKSSLVKTKIPSFFHDSPYLVVFHLWIETWLGIAWPLRLPSSGANWSRRLTSHLGDDSVMDTSHRFPWDISDLATLKVENGNKFVWNPRPL